MLIVEVCTWPGVEMNSLRTLPCEVFGSSAELGNRAWMPFSGSLMQLFVPLPVQEMTHEPWPEPTGSVQVTPLDSLRLSKRRPSSPMTPSWPVPPETQSLPQPATIWSFWASPKMTSLPQPV